MNKLFFLIFFVPIAVLSDTTGNLLPQQFFNNNQEHNEWNCNDPSHNHGNSIIAGVHGDTINRDVKLSDHLTEDQIKNGFSSTLGADIWHWYRPVVSETDMIQTFTGSDGTVTIQKRTVILDDYTPYQTYTDTYVQERSTNKDYNINVQFNFREDSQSQLHRAVDLKNPTLVIEYDPNPIFLNTQQTEVINESVENIDDVVNVLDNISPIPTVINDDFDIEFYEEPDLILTDIEDFNLIEDPIEQLQTGVINVFTEVLDYDNQENFSEVSTEIQIQESFFETAEVSTDFNEQANEIINEIYIATDTNLSEELAEEIGGEITTAEISRDDDISETRIEEDMGFEESNEGTISEGNSAETEIISRENGETDSISENSNEIENEPETLAQANQPDNEPEAENNTPTEEITEDDMDNNSDLSDNESTNNLTGESNANETEEREETETQTVRNTNQVEEETEQDTQIETVVNISVADIEKKVSETVDRVDERLFITSMIIAKAMSGNTSLVDNYAKRNNDFFSTQREYQTREYKDERIYVDNRTLYAEDKRSYNDPMEKYNKDLQEKINNRIRAEENLKNIRGY